jgi:uncharacterized repeat protein (TIGR03806 family)
MRRRSSSLVVTVLLVVACSANDNSRAMLDASAGRMDAGDRPGSTETDAPTTPRRPSNPTCKVPPFVPQMGSAGLPARLSETGCFDQVDPTRPLPALIPYDVNAPLWSDGATKERWLALPDDTTMQVQADGDLQLPPGAVTIKTFSIGGRKIETRFFVRLMTGEWSGYTYEWNEAGSDATVLDEGSRRRPIAGGEWHYPTRAECNKCHTAGAGFSLGLEIAQLNLETDEPDGARTNQLTRWQRMGLFASMLPDEPARLPTLPPETDNRATLEARARAYLHANCSNCHRPEVDGSGTTDFRFPTTLASTGACDAEPLRDNLGAGAEARIIAPGNPDKSMVVLRMRELGRGRMPEFASLVVDQRGVSLISDWIRGLARCP